MSSSVSSLFATQDLFQLKEGGDYNLVCEPAEDNLELELLFLRELNQRVVVDV